MRRERETQSFYADCFYIVSSQPNQRAAPVAHKFVWHRPGLNLGSLVWRQPTAFSQIPKILSPRFRAWRHSHPLAPTIWDFYFDISEWHILSAPAWTPALMLHLTNPCAKLKVPSLTKPKGKIYKMKSLGNYITALDRSTWNYTIVYGLLMLRIVTWDYNWLKITIVFNFLKP